ncbi:TetR/AcrR family transcriptional regulator [Microbulbifer sp. 2201CG32-9]|uniref:TetR/AcrR family transcriptional regulator n=1 Tax=unclassified Microbulbifer TaxID=2619833 RepID=UPI00345B58C5
MSKVDKEAIIRAAEDVVRENGARKLTLDAVANRCGLSKGGLLHHYGSKQALLQAMLQSVVARESELANAYLDCNDQPGGLLVSRIQTLFAMMEEPAGLPRSLIAAVAEDPALLEPIKNQEERIRNKVCDDSSDPEMALLLLCAARGIFFGRVLGVVEEDAPLFRRLRERLLKLAQDLD